MSRNPSETEQADVADEVRRYVRSRLGPPGETTPAQVGAAVIHGCLEGLGYALPVPIERDGEAVYWDDDPGFGLALTSMFSTAPVNETRTLIRFWARFFAMAASVSKESATASAIISGPDRLAFPSTRDGFEQWKRAMTVNVAWIGYCPPHEVRLPGENAWEHKAMRFAIEDAWQWAAVSLTRAAVEAWARAFVEPDPNLQLERIARALDGIG